MCTHQPPGNVAHTPAACGGRFVRRSHTATPICHALSAPCCCRVLMLRHEVTAVWLRRALALRGRWRLKVKLADELRAKVEE